MAEITTAEYLQDLVNQKNTLVSTLQECGIEANMDEKFNTLIPKIKKIINNTDLIFEDDLTHDNLMSIINALKDFTEQKVLRYPHGSFGNYSVRGYDQDPKRITFDVTSATLNDTTLVCQGKHNNYDVTITVTDIDISQEDVANIKTIVQDFVDYDPETGFITDVIITTVSKPNVRKILILSSTNLAKLTDEEKKIATDKGWILVSSST